MILSELNIKKGSTKQDVMLSPIKQESHSKNANEFNWSKFRPQKSSVHHSSPLKKYTTPTNSRMILPLKDIHVNEISPIKHRYLRKETKEKSQDNTTQQYIFTKQKSQPKGADKQISWTETKNKFNQLEKMEMEENPNSKENKTKNKDNLINPLWETK